MACYDSSCPCSNAPKCKCQPDWDVRRVCPPGDSWNCPVRSNTAVWLIDNDEDLHKAARERRNFDGINGWFNLDDQVSFWKTVSLYSQGMIDELRSEEVEDTYTLCCWIEEKKKADAIVYEIENDESEEQAEARLISQCQKCGNKAVYFRCYKERPDLLFRRCADCVQPWLQGGTGDPGHGDEGVDEWGVKWKFNPKKGCGVWEPIVAED